MSLLTERQLVTELARHGMMRVSPEELPLFRAFCTEFGRDPARLLKLRARRADLFGFGPADPIELITRPAFIGSAVAVSCLRDSGREVFREVTRVAIRELLEQLLTRMRRTADNRARLREARSAITPSFLKTLRDVLYGAGVELGISAEASGKLSDALVSRVLDVCHDPPS